jgi:hypothetical protein
MRPRPDRLEVFSTNFTFFERWDARFRIPYDGWLSPYPAMSPPPPSKFEFMPYRNIFISTADVQAVKTAIAILKEKLPFLASLTADERQAIFKTEAASVFHSPSPQLLSRNKTGLLPQRFAVSESAPEVDLVTVLADLVTAVERLMAETETQAPAVGGEAMKEKTQVYTYVKTAALNTTVVKLCFSVEVYSYVETVTGNT